MKKINFLGIEMNVMDDADIQEQADKGDIHYYVVSRVADMDPHAGPPELHARRQRTPCENCQEICYVDPKSLDQVGALNLTIICTRCMVDRAKKEDAGDQGQ